MKKPSNTKIIKAKKSWLVPSGFVAITLFGTVYCHSEIRVEEINKTDGIDCQLESHEAIHVRQAESTKNSWLLFYILYIWQKIKNMPLIFIDINAPYKFSAFELEAYAYQDDWNYCKNICTKWKSYDKLTMKQKRELAKKYYNSDMYFTKFIHEEIDPLIE